MYYSLLSCPSTSSILLNSPFPPYLAYLHILGFTLQCDRVPNIHQRCHRVSAESIYQSRYQLDHLPSAGRCIIGKTPPTCFLFTLHLPLKCTTTDHRTSCFLLYVIITVQFTCSCSQLDYFILHPNWRKDLAGTYINYYNQGSSGMYRGKGVRNFTIRSRICNYAT